MAAFDRMFAALARDDGFALNDGQILPGMAAVALPVPFASGRPSATISVAAIISRIDPVRQIEIIAIVRAEMQGTTRVR